MTIWTLTLRSVRHYWRGHLAVLAGAAIATAVLTGALFAGDSVTHSLRRTALLRLGGIEHAAFQPGRFFEESLAPRLESESGAPVAAALDVAGMALRADDAARVNQARILGVDAAFWRMGHDTALELGPNEAALGRATADALGVAAGGELAVRVQKPSLMPRDAPLSSREDESTVRLLVRVKVVLSDEQLGRFSLSAHQAAPHNIFLDRAWLQQWLELPGQANLFLAGSGGDTARLDAALRKCWRIEDAGLRLRAHPSGLLQLESKRIFLDAPVVKAALQQDGAQGALSYLVNTIAKDGKMTPYSFAVAGPLSPALEKNQAVINQWLADKLDARPGDTLRVQYYTLSPANEFVPRETELTVARVESMETLAREREFMSVFPGLTDVERCADWKIGMPMDEALLEDPDNEAYWEAHGPTPKLLVSLETGQALWGNRFGDCTAIRFENGTAREAELRAALNAAIAPADTGLQFAPVRQQALQSVEQAMDFGGLFLGLSSFLIASALIFTGLLFVFGVQQRAAQMGLLLALGIPARLVRRWLDLEAALVAACGAVAGLGLAALYTRALLFGLAHQWSAAVAGAIIEYHARPCSAMLGLLAGLVISLGAMRWAARRQTRRSAIELLSADFTAAPPPALRRPGTLPLVLSILGLAAAAALAATLWLAPPDQAAGAFFGIGALFLCSGIALLSQTLRRLENAGSARRWNLARFAAQNLARRRGRSLGVASSIACGAFMVFSVASMQEDLGAAAHRRDSGTGGFELYAESAVPIQDDLAAALKMPGVTVVPLRLRAGDEASCLNLNHAAAPPLLGVDPEKLAALSAFAPGGEWQSLQQSGGGEILPAMVGDANTAMWALKQPIGPEDGGIIEYRNESGAPFQVRLTNRLPMRLSVFQGRLLLDERAFTRQFPSEHGYRVFLVDTPEGQAEQAREALTRLFERHGLECVPAVDRLYLFYRVELAYLAMFLVLGALALLLGGAGAGIVILRNLFERRAELALLRALGFPFGTVLRLQVAEQAALMGAGIGIGGLAAALAMPPALWSGQSMHSAWMLACTAALVVLLLGGVLWLAVRTGLERGEFAALRNEQ